MSALSFRVLGCGDAFCSGGRLQTCFYVQTPSQTLLLDCGATTLIGMQRQDVDPSTVDRILLSHLHGDHFGGVPFFLMHAHFVAGRTRPLEIVGPKGSRERMRRLLDILFPDVKEINWRFPVSFVELAENRIETLGDVRLTPRLVDHPSGASAFAFRLEVDGKVLAFTGDTRWTSALIDIADGADLLIAECHAYQPNGAPHLDWRTLNARKSELRAKRILLTHMGDDMLARLSTLDRSRFEIAEDGWATAL